MNLALIGLRGAGKSAVGRMVAERLGWEFLDLDDETPRVLGVDGAREAWEKFGEQVFRRAETVALARALSIEGRVVALGGGTPTAMLAAELLEHEKAGRRLVVVYLKASAETLRTRLAGADNSHRPSLTGAGVLEEVEEVLRQRDGLYVRLADAVIETDRLEVGEVVDRVSRMWKG